MVLDWVCDTPVCMIASAPNDGNLLRMCKDHGSPMRSWKVLEEPLKSHELRHSCYLRSSAYPNGFR